MENNKKRRGKKWKLIIYSSAFVIQIVITLIISEITGVSTANTWLGAVSMTAFFATLTILLLDIRKSILNTHQKTVAIIEIITLLTVVAIIIANVAFFIGQWRA